MKPETETQKRTLQEVRNYIRNKYHDEGSGHDHFHIFRVASLARKLCEEEDDVFLVQLVALLHEEMDDKMNQHANQEASLLNLLGDFKIGSGAAAIVQAIQSIGFKGGFQQKQQSRIAEIVSDADALEAMGAIGIGRTFYYAGAHHNPFHDPDLEQVVVRDFHDYRHLKRNCIAHFDEKLLKLHDRMKTRKGQEFALKRHQVLEDFYQEFYEELAMASDD